MKIQRNSTVTLHHQIGFTDGTLLENTFDDEPMTIQLGQGELAEGLELALLELQQGDEQTLDIAPDLAFGFPDPALRHEFDRNDFESPEVLEEGLIMEFYTPNGDMVPGTITQIDGDRISVDLNHPLAGQTVRYRVKIIDVQISAENLTH